MDAALLRDFGSEPDFGPYDEPRAANGHSVAEISVAGLNPIDLAIGSGTMPGCKPALPSVPGLEGIATIGERRVYFDTPIAPFGSMAERALVNPDALIEVPDGIDDAQAVGFGISGLAAWLSLTWHAGLERGESVLVLGASGVVGQIAVQAARLCEAGRVVAATRGDEGLERARELGADGVVELNGEGDLTEAFAEAGGGGFDVVIDPLWGEPAMAALGALNRHGRLIQIGNAAGAAAEIPIRDLREKLASVIGHTNFNTPQELKEDAFRQMCRHAIAGDLKLEVEEIGLPEVAEAWRRQGESPHHKLVLRVS
jgi:NADPH:quinone reductase-like Zn-dependent oxidoreductase